MQRAAQSPVQNLLLAALPRQVYKRIASHLEPVSLTFGQVLYEPGKRIRHVYFPSNAVISLLTVAGQGKSAEVGMVGNEGLVGGFAALGIFVSHLRAVVQRTGIAARITSSLLHSESRANTAWFRELFRFAHAQMNQAAQSAVCNRFHRIEARLARWLLMTRDRVQSDHFHLTHEFLSRMVGARRVGITSAAFGLQRRGPISYSRGNIQILDPGVLKAAACECYGVGKEIFRLSYLT